MSASDELISLDEELKQLQIDDAMVTVAELDLEAQIQNLRAELTKLKDKKYQTKRKIREFNKERESIERKVELEEQSARLEAEIKAKEAEAYELIKDAPWLKDAFDWQIKGAIQLPDRALVGDKRGMGKTLTSIIWRRTHKSKRTLVCLRKEVASDFIKELNIREPGLFIYPMLGVTPQGREVAAMLLSGFDEYVVVTNIESWRRDVDGVTEAILKLPFDGVILDEAHNIKNFNTGTAQGFMRLAQRLPKVLELTGTPIKNKPQEMFSLLHALYPLNFPSEKFFLRDFCERVSQNKWTFTEWGLVSLVKKISSFYIARSPEDVGRKVPPPRMIEYKLDFENHPAQKKAYQIMNERSMAELSTGHVIPIVSQLAIMTRLAQATSWPAGIVFKVKDDEGFPTGEEIRFDVEESVKADWAENLIGELVEEGERVIMFSRFKPAIYEMRKRLEANGLSVAVITGDEKSNTKAILDDFDLKTAPEKPRWQVLLATYQTVGESANLNAARHMVLYDRYWNPGNDDQAIGRIDRINSVDQATVHLPSIEYTIDDYMITLIDEKRDIVSGFKSASDQQAALLANLERAR